MSSAQVIEQANNDFKKAIEHLKHEFSKLQVGRANPTLLEEIKVEVYGTQQLLKGLANISIPDSRTLQIQPWDKNTVGSIEKAILNSGLSLNPINDGSVIRVVVPALTQERRVELIKIVHKMAEENRISVRNYRQSYLNKLKEMEKNKEITEDELHGAEKKLQEKVDLANKEIEELAKKKEQDVMTV